MFTEQFIHEAGEMLQEQADMLVITQYNIASSYYAQRSGKLLSSLSNLPKVSGLNVDIRYPLHIRFLDMKRSRTGKKKREYDPIYNKYVQGFLYYGTYRKLSRGISGMVVAQFKQQIENAK